MAKANEGVTKIPRLDMALPRRPDSGGSKGRRATVLANFFSLDITDPSMELFIYDVTIEDPVEDTSEPLRRRSKLRKEEEKLRNMGCFMVAKEKHMPDQTVAYDRQKLLVSKGPLKITNQQPKSEPSSGGVSLGDCYDLQCDNVLLPSGRKENFLMRLTKVMQFKLKELEAYITLQADETKNLVPLQCIDLILRQKLFYNDSLMYSGRSFYSMKPECSLGRGTGLHKGVFFTAKVISGGNASKKFALAVNADVANSAFYEAINVVEFMCQVYGADRGELTNGMPQQYVKMFAKEIKSFRMKSTHIKRNIICKGLSENTARTQTFMLKNREDDTETEKTVEQYFMDRYKMKLEFPNLPLVITGPKTNPTFFPMEVLELRPMQKTPNTKLKDEQLATIIKKAALPADQRAQEVSSLIQTNQIGRDNISSAFGLKMQHNMIKVPARVLEVPNLIFKNQTIRPAKGQWRIDNAQFNVGAKMQKYSVIIYRGGNRLGTDSIWAFLTKINEYGSFFGMEIGEPKNVLQVNSTDELNAAFEKVVQEEKKTEIIWVFMQNKDGRLYSEVKRLGDVKFGVMTQVICGRVVNDACGPKGNMTLCNIMLKLNLKLGGDNQRLDPSDSVVQTYFNSNTLFVGIDVTHPGPGSFSPSVAAMASNINCPPTRYVAQVRVQESREDRILELNGMITEALKVYYKNTKRKPERIIIYRDGVSEGQIEEVLKFEVSSIREACDAMNPDGTFKPKLSFISVQKRHHTRFVPENVDASMRPPDRNIQPGTVVDQGVVHPTQFNFYLCAHQGIQGTSKPILLHVLQDENAMSSDDVESITFLLTHLFGRCPRSVSLPAPVYYADRVAFRARMHLRGGELDDETTSLSSGGQRMALDISQSSVNVGKGIKSQMYFL